MLNSALRITKSFRLHYRWFSDSRIQTEIVKIFSESRTVFDLTFGDGHHSRLLLQDGDRRVLALDKDTNAANIYKTMEDKNFHGFIGKFSDFPAILRENEELVELVENCGGIILDLGPSESQIMSSKGFCLEKNEPLDLRMGEAEKSAHELLEHLSMEHLIKVLKVYGGVKNAKNIATDIIEKRYLLRAPKTTDDLRNLLELCMSGLLHFQGEGGDEKIKTNLRNVFLGLRMFVNDELNQLSFALKLAHNILPKGCQVAVIVRSQKEEDHLRRLANVDSAKMSTGLFWEIQTILKTEDDADIDDYCSLLTLTKASTNNKL